MSWITNFVRPKIQALIKREDTSEALWSKCPKCEHMLFHRDLILHQQVCHHCNHHFRLPVLDRLNMLFDEGVYTLMPTRKVPNDPLKFKDTKRYADRLKEYRSKTGRDDAVLVAYGNMGQKPAVICAFDFSFMGGSMGMAAGAAFLSACDAAVQTHAPLIVVSTSGGARMQEGILSLMQMPRTILGVQKLRAAGLPYITLLTDPTTGGVSASFAMLGDVALAEPGTMIGFAGARVIEETMRQKLPEGFQTAEYVCEHGMIDAVVPRSQLRSILMTLIGHMMRDNVLVRQPNKAA